MKYVIDEMREFLNLAGITRNPDVPHGEPPCWLAPPGGLPSPGEREAGDDYLLVGLYPAPGVVMDVMEQQWLVTEAVDVYIRVAPTWQPDALRLGRKIKQEMTHPMGFQMSGLRVEQCTEARPLQLISTDEAGGAVYAMTFEFLIRDESFDTPNFAAAALSAEASLVANPSQIYRQWAVAKGETALAAADLITIKLRRTRARPASTGILRARATESVVPPAGGGNPGGGGRP